MSIRSSVTMYALQPIVADSSVAPRQQPVSTAAAILLPVSAAAATPLPVAAAAVAAAPVAVTVMKAMNATYDCLCRSPLDLLSATPPSLAVSSAVVVGVVSGLSLPSLKSVFSPEGSHIGTSSPATICSCDSNHMECTHVYCGCNTASVCVSLHCNCLSSHCSIAGTAAHAGSSC
jgi:hypothetical protein